MALDIVIKNGRILDPASNTDAIGDLHVHKGRIVAPDTEPIEKTTLVVDASDCIVTPGLIDIHVHMYQYATDNGADPDSFFPMGVTALVDGGSAGVDGFEGFARNTLARARTNAYCLLNVSPVGIPTERWAENIDPKYFDPNHVSELVAAYPGYIKGLKIRMSQHIAGDLGYKPLEAAVKLAEKVGLPLAVHTSNPPGDSQELVNLLRSGDIYAHCFNPHGSTVLDEAGKIKPAFIKARERGVIFDTSSARIHSSFPMVKSVIEQGFLPDVLSTDLVNFTQFNTFVYGLPFIMTYYMAAGMPLTDAVAAATSTPARVMNLEGLGSLAVGRQADITVFKLQDHPINAKDYYGNTMPISSWLVPQYTVLKGKTAFRQMCFRTE